MRGSQHDVVGLPRLRGIGTLLLTRARLFDMRRRVGGRRSQTGWVLAGRSGRSRRTGRSKPAGSRAASRPSRPTCPPRPPCPLRRLTALTAPSAYDQIQPPPPTDPPGPGLPVPSCLRRIAPAGTSTPQGGGNRSHALHYRAGPRDLSEAGRSDGIPSSTIVPISSPSPHGRCAESLSTTPDVTAPSSVLLGRSRYRSPRWNDRTPSSPIPRPGRSRKERIS